MESKKKKLIFDTSAVNQLADDQTNAIARAVGIAYQVKITGTSVAESAATGKAERRELLIRTLRLLVSDGICLLPARWIFRSQVAEYMKDKDKFAWGQVDIRSRSTEQSIVGENLLSDENSEVIRDENKTLAKEFEALYRTERIDFEAFFARSGDERPSFGRHCALALKNGGPGWELATGLVKQATGDVVSERDVRDIMNRCPPVRAFFVALLWSYHRKCVLYARRKTVGNAGRDDLLSAVYLPYCDVFVTDDHGQYEALTEIAAETQISSLVQMYEAFSQSLLGVSA